MRRQTKTALERLRVIFEEPGDGPLSGPPSRATRRPRRRASAPTPGWTRPARPVRAPNRLPGRMVLSRATIAAACVLALLLGRALRRQQRHEAGRLDEPAREGLALDLDGVTYNVFITRQLNTDDPAGRRLLRRTAAGQGRDALRRLHPGLQPDEGASLEPDRLLQGQGQPGQRVPGRSRCPRTARSPTACASSSPRTASPRTAASPQQGPAAGVTAALQAARSRRPRTGRSSSRSRARTGTTSPTSWISEGIGASRRAGCYRKSPPERLPQHQPRRRRRRLAAGAVAHQQHADRDARPPAGA